MTDWKGRSGGGMGRFRRMETKTSKEGRSITKTEEKKVVGREHHIMGTTRF